MGFQVPRNGLFNIMKLESPTFEKLPQDQDGCWRQLRRFAAYWYPDHDSPWIESEPETHLPPTVLKWHQEFGFTRSWCCRAENLAPKDMFFHNERLVLRREHILGEHYIYWGIPNDRLGEPDPPVISIYGDREYDCVQHVSHFAIICALFDTADSRRCRELPADNQYPFPSDGVICEFPSSFGMIETENSPRS